MGKRWTIENVPEETINAIKQRAIDYGCSIGQVLATDYTKKHKVEKKNNWTIWNIPNALREEIIETARKSNLTVPSLLRKLLRHKDQPRIEKEVKEQLVREVMDCLKNFKKG